MFRITAFAGALLCLLIVPASAQNLHPRCNIDWPCVGATTLQSTIDSSVTHKSARKLKYQSPRDRFRNVEFGGPLEPGETANSVINASRPSGCPARAWCGCWLMKHLGLSDRSLWLARRWASIGADAGGPRVGAIVVWTHHVGKITAVDGHRIKVLSGNDGRAVRDRWRTTAGVIAYRVQS
jgi:hypothetical protein